MEICISDKKNKKYRACITQKLNKQQIFLLTRASGINANIVCTRKCMCHMYRVMRNRKLLKEPLCQKLCFKLFLWNFSYDGGQILSKLS